MQACTGAALGRMKVEARVEGSRGQWCVRGLTASAKF